MGAYLHLCFGSIHVENAAKLAALFSTIIALVTTFIVTFLLVTVNDGFPILIQVSEFTSPAQYAFWLIYEWISIYRLVFFYLEQTVQVFVSVLFFLGVWTRTSVLISPFIYFSIFLIFTSIIEIGESIYAIVTIKDRLTMAQHSNNDISKVLTQFSVAKLMLILCIYCFIWIATRIRAPTR